MFQMILARKNMKKITIIFDSQKVPFKNNMFKNRFPIFKNVFITILSFFCHSVL